MGTIGGYYKNWEGDGGTEKKQERENKSESSMTDC